MTHHAPSDQTSPLPHKTRRARIDDHPSWSPDGERIAVARGERGSRDLYVVSTVGDEPVSLLEHASYDYWAPSWSPNRDVSVDPAFDCRS